MMTRLIIIFIIISFAIISCNSKSGNRKAQSELSDSQSELSAETDNEGFLKVTKVVDGDTFWADDGSAKGIKIRLIGIDAPESRNVFKKKKGYYGVEAKNYLTQLLKNQRIRLEFDIDSLDQYGRTLAYVYLLDGKFVNAELVKNGYAMVMTVPPNVKYADEFVKYQQEARENNRGLWNVEN